MEERGVGTRYAEEKNAWSGRSARRSVHSSCRYRGKVTADR